MSVSVDIPRKPLVNSKKTLLTRDIHNLTVIDD